nr:MAG TPA: hypothetical protein [Caudoviricetes sp.]
MCKLICSCSHLLVIRFILKFFLLSQSIPYSKFLIKIRCF